ncbi:hypothetical protein DPMN_122953 [Dreissena polymorpha]|uniref:Uncharacterized protein n=1 Tax=Dreissena polymorpha TaxID=45954 RepID=A0A9D4GWH3_DREPO|nr:hypothetical protein DPMN_122953 [Dreissena polymorpha]
MLLPFVSILEPEQEIQTVSKVRKYSKPSQTGSDSDSSSRSDSVVKIYRIPQRRNTNTNTSVTPDPVTSIRAPAISHSSQSLSIDSISQPIPASPSNQSVTAIHSTPVHSLVSSPFSHESSPNTGFSLSPSKQESSPTSRPVRQRRPPDRFGE